MKILFNKIFNPLKRTFKQPTCCFHSESLGSKYKPPWKILFFGTDEFSVASLTLLFNEYEKQKLVSKLEVVTSRSKTNPVRKFAATKQLPTHDWPITNKIEGFQLGLVVSFGHMIPENIINMFPLGMLNVHASLLPRWRGAAPIIYAIANGDRQTGVSIMKIQPKKFDCGEILVQKPIDIPSDIKMPELHARLASLGAETLVKSLDNLTHLLENCLTQKEEGVTLAPRVDGKIARVDWTRLTARQVYNLFRALTGLFHITTYWNEIPVKLHSVKEHERTASESEPTDIVPGRVIYDRSNKQVLVQCRDGQWISCDKVGVLNKKVMSAADFNNGYLKKEVVDRRIFK